MKFSGIFAGELSGSVGALTASRNRFGSYFREKAIPVNPQSSRQTAVRTNFATLVAAWTNTLTQVERDAWIVWADNTPQGGEGIILTGLNAYVRANSIRLQIGETRIDDAPIIFNNGAPVTSIEILTDGTTNEIGVDLAGTGNATTVNVSGTFSFNGDTAIYIGQPVSEGIGFFKGPFQLMAVVPFLTAGSSIDIDQLLSLNTNDNTNLVAGQRRAIRIRNMYDDGRLSTPFDLLTAVVADSV